MSLQMTIPFTVTENGSVQTESDIDVQTAHRIRALVGTEPGQRAMRAGLGIPLSRLLFGVGDDLIGAELRQLVTQQLDTYEPGTTITSLTPVIDQANDGIAALEVDFAPILQASPTRQISDRAIIEVGGTVREIPASG